MKFLRVEPYNTYSYWRQHIQRPFEEDEDTGIAALQSLLKPILLRRTKLTTDAAGKPIVTLPSSQVDLVLLDFSPAGEEKKGGGADCRCSSGSQYWMAVVCVSRARFLFRHLQAVQDEVQRVPGVRKGTAGLAGLESPSIFPASSDGFAWAVAQQLRQHPGAPAAATSSLRSSLPYFAEQSGASARRRDAPGRRCDLACEEGGVWGGEGGEGKPAPLHGIWCCRKGIFACLFGH